jgi:DNA-binding IclR family transcriptional regulator
MTRHPGASFTVSQLAREVGVPRATCDAILQALAVHRLVTRRDPDLHYELGPAGIALGDAARTANPVLRAATIEAERLARAVGCCVAVSVNDGDSVRVCDVFDFGPVFALRARVGQAIPLVPPFGAVFVAWADDDAEAWLARADTTLTREERERYRRVLRAVRQRGYSISMATPRRPELVEAVETLVDSPESDQARFKRDELIREMMHSTYLPADLDDDAVVRVAQISAPVFDERGRAAASLLVPGPGHDITAAALRGLAGQVVEAASRATCTAGGREPASAAGDFEMGAPSRAGSPA